MRFVGWRAGEFERHCCEVVAMLGELSQFLCSFLMKAIHRKGEMVFRKYPDQAIGLDNQK
jgi:hypothetical protein